MVKGGRMVKPNRDPSIKNRRTRELSSGGLRERRSIVGANEICESLMEKPGSYGVFFGKTEGHHENQNVDPANNFGSDQSLL